MSVKVEGLEQVRDKLQALGKKEASKVSRKATRAGAKIVKAEISSLMPVRTGNAKRSLKVRAAKRRTKGTIGVIVGFGKKWFAGPAFYISFVVFGRMTGRKTSANRSKIQGNPFMQQGYDNSKSMAVGAMTDTYHELLDL